MRIVHLSDLHLRDQGDLAAFGRQIDRVAETHPAHLAITGDLLAAPAGRSARCIYLLIAGTYTPFVLGPLRGPWGWSA